ncbi:hypothetical protein NPX13_g10592 [Xylaria arbuscula]|uniref:Uncharacterized protein n=1 Tax=Xylaria arbuscula TaxID=114810 RepID=A0A9W8THU9_9PEZI|nr:hypothetical protein NPX13_g10592 [Xylaria arbuscula]
MQPVKVYGTSDPELLLMLKEELSHKIRTHGKWLLDFWYDMPLEERIMAVDNALPGGAEAPTPPIDLDLIPEWNIARLEPEASLSFQDLVLRRGTLSLTTQYLGESDHNDTGDHFYIDRMIKTKRLCHADPFNNWYTFFTKQKYGESIEVKTNNEKIQFVLKNKRLIDAKLCVPRAKGELILARQTRLLLRLNLLIYELLEAINDPTSTHTRSNLYFDTNDFMEILSRHCHWILDRLVAMERHSYVLQHYLQYWLLSRPEQVADHEGYKPEIHEEKCISVAFLDVMHSIARRMAIWHYIQRMLRHLDETETEDERNIALEELASVSCLEYRHVHAMLRRQLSTAKIAAPFFKQDPSVSENGNAQIRLKDNPANLATADDQKQLHYLLRLCANKTLAPKALYWLEKLNELYRDSPTERDVLGPNVMHAVGDLADIAHFIQILSEAREMPVLKHQRKDGFAQYATELENNINQLRDLVDLSSFIDSTMIDPVNIPLLEDALPAAVKAFREFIVDKLGSDITQSYGRVIYKSVESFVKRRGLLTYQSTAASTSLQAPPADVALGGPRTRPTAKPVQVDANTFDLFSSFFREVDEVNRPVFCDRFEATLEKLGFKAVRGFGTVIAFYPPEESDIVDEEARSTPFIFNRGYNLRIDISARLLYAHHLWELYGWNQYTFVTA